MHSLWILAQNFDEVSQALRRQQNRSITLSEIGFLVVALGAIALFWVVLYYWDKIRSGFRRQVNDPQTLFLDLCKAHGLKSSERTLLRSAADSLGLAQPAMVFINPDILGELAGRNTPEAAACRELAGKLFGPEITP